MDTDDLAHGSGALLCVFVTEAITVNANYPVLQFVPDKLPSKSFNT